MKLKALGAAVLGVSLLLSAGGCGITNLSKDDMLRPPKTMGDEAEIEQLIASSSKGGYTLKYPKSGSHRNAVTMHDIDGDGVNEAIAFFRDRDKDGSTGVHIMVMYERDGKWALSGDLTTETTDVDCLDFSDVNYDGTQEILVGYSTYTAGVNFLSVYTYQNGKTGTIESGQNYSSFYCGNLDGKSKVITLSLFNNENEAKATMLEYDPQRNALYAQTSVAMDGNVASYKNVVFSDLGNGANGLVVDGFLTSGEMVTQIIYYDPSDNVLANPLYRDHAQNVTQRKQEVLSADINNDGKVAIPTVSALPFSTKSGSPAAADQLVWNSFHVETAELQPVQRTVVNYDYSYTIKIPDTWQEGSFTALPEENNAVLAFCEWNGDGPGVRLFDIKVFATADWDQKKGTEAYQLISKDSRYAYAFINHHPGGTMTLENDAIKSAFSLLNKSTGSTGNISKPNP